MKIERITPPADDFTRIQIGGIAVTEGPRGLWATGVNLQERAGRWLDRGFFARVLGAEDTVIFSARTADCADLPDLLGRIHNAVCDTFGPQPLEYELEGVDFVRHPNGAVYDIETAAA
jgi:hypothetical protein